MDQKPVFLCGMMGSGKSSTGNSLAKKLSLPFTDLDSIIEEREKKTIPEIFGLEGEAAFRKIESELLTSIASNAQGIVALGGGSLQNQEIVDMLKTAGWLIFLNCPRAQLIKRLRNSTSRPMLLQKNGTELEQRINNLLRKRLLYYKQAHITINTSGFGPGKVADIIIKQITDYEDRD